jgi:hypothetical protein
MRLADELIAAGSDPDNPYPEDAKSVAAAVASAAHFELDEGVLHAGLGIMNSRLDDILRAKHLIRAPHKTAWLEWKSGGDEFGRFWSKRPFGPGSWRVRSGALIETTGERGSAGRMSFYSLVAEGAARQRDIALEPLCVRFDFDVDNITSGFVVQQRTAVADSVADALYEKLQDPASVVVLEKLRGSSREALQECMRRISFELNPHLGAMIGERGEGWLHSEDANGDLQAAWRFFMLCEALLICLNSRNLVDVGPAEDLAKLNRARAKSRKSPLVSMPSGTTWVAA